MAVYSVTTNAPQETALTNLVGIINQLRAIRGQAVITNADFVQATVIQDIQEQGPITRSGIKERINNSLDGATSAQIANVRAALGL